MAGQVKPRPQYPTPPRVDKTRKRLSKQRRERLTTDAEYNALAAIYLEQNPDCAVCCYPATQVHHICSGTAGRAASLLNSDTWIACCQECHDWIETLPFERQVKLKVLSVKETIARLRT